MTLEEYKGLKDKSSHDINKWWTEKSEEEKLDRMRQSVMFTPRLILLIGKKKPSEIDEWFTGQRRKERLVIVRITVWGDTSQYGFIFNPVTLQWELKKEK